MSACLAARQLSGGWFDPWAMSGGFDPTGYVKGGAVSEPWRHSMALRWQAPW